MNANARIIRLALFTLAALLLLPTAARAVPNSDGLVLWLDAADDSTVSQDATGRVRRWADKSSAANHALQKSVDSQPAYAAESIGSKPAIRFDGRSFLNLGKPEGLNFTPKKPFTIAVVYAASGGQMGTFISKGGGSANRRAYQFYTTPRGLGAIAYGSMREGPVERGPNVAMFVCDGTQSQVYARGGPVFSAAAGRSKSTCDVLIGARRKETDNSGAYYMLGGDVAEIVVYNRALGPKELNRLGQHFAEKYDLNVGSLTVDSVEGLADALRSPKAPARVDSLTETVIRFGDKAAPALESLIADPVRRPDGRRYPSTRRPEERSKRRPGRRIRPTA